jgi:hypothetical protein
MTRELHRQCERLRASNKQLRYWRKDLAFQKYYCTVVLDAVLGGKGRHIQEFGRQPRPATALSRFRKAALAVMALKRWSRRVSK